jgi:tRNA A-37 threonylcarbamoyl transferase component Bud32
VYYVNWQRQVSVEERGGQRVVVKRSKPTTAFHEYILLSTYTMISLLLGHPSAPPHAGSVSKNEGRDMRDRLGRLDIPAPKLVSITDDELIEEYVEGGDLYRALASGDQPPLARRAGELTGRLHRAGYVFTDNKAQNYLVRGDSLLRTDLGFLQKNESTYARSMDVGSFLASVIDLPGYCDVERVFYEGYRFQAGRNFPYLSIVIRNILSAGFASDTKTALRNMVADTCRLIAF